MVYTLCYDHVFFAGSSSNVAFLDSGMDPKKEATEVSTTKVQTLNYAEIVFYWIQRTMSLREFPIARDPNKKKKAIKPLKPPISPLGIIYLSVGIVKFRKFIWRINPIPMNEWKKERRGDWSPKSKFKKYDKSDLCHIIPTSSHFSLLRDDYNSYTYLWHSILCRHTASPRLSGMIKSVYRLRRDGLVDWALVKVTGSPPVAALSALVLKVEPNHPNWNLKKKNKKRIAKKHTHPGQHLNLLGSHHSNYHFLFPTQKCAPFFLHLDFFSTETSFASHVSKALCHESGKFRPFRSREDSGTWHGWLWN